MKIYSSKHQAIVEAPILQEPDILNEKYDDVFTDHFANDTDAYNKWLSTHTHATPELQRLLKDGQEVKEGIDYRLDYPPPYMPETEEEAIEAANEERRELTQYPKQVAIPIKQVSEEEPSPQQEVEDSLKREAYEKATRLCLSNPTGTRMDIIYKAMEIYSQSQLSQALSTIEKRERDLAYWKLEAWAKSDNINEQAQTITTLQQKIKDQEAEIEAMRKQLK